MKGGGQADFFAGAGDFRGGAAFPWEAGKHAAKRATLFLQSLKVPEGPRAGQAIRLAGYQREFIRGALRQDTAAAVLSVGRGNGKSAL